ncbi:MBL fold metallo-hydrolase [Candidatus Curculioniphilus buchneri]|uniref:MBL fold metallo-hydrolase n=1 Tax=Candidatus Curculioniphilus buchneri TaxID=690594 RepID=UPI00376F3EF3
MQYHIIPVTVFKQNCSLIWCDQTKEAALIDPGGDVSRLRQEIKMCGVMVNKILLTHGHLDHVGAARELASFYKIPIIGPHCNDKLFLDNLSDQCRFFGIGSIPPLIPDQWLLEGDTINVGNITFSVLHCPGHSPGHVVFWDKAEKFILMGDVLFKDNIGRTDLPGGDIKTLMQSIHQLMMLDNDIVFLPGHGPMSTLGRERFFNPKIEHYYIQNT